MGDNRVRAGAIFLAGLAAVVGMFSCQEGPYRESMELTAHPARIGGQPVIRVAVKTGAVKVDLTCCSALRIKDDRDRSVFETAKAESGLQVSSTPAGWFVGGRLVGGGEYLDIEVSDGSDRGENGVRVDGVGYGKRVVLARESRLSPRFAVVAHMDIETYLAGVLAAEVPFERWHPEALKAQAVASRTYAVYHMKLRVAEPYDVDSTTMSQVYKTGYATNPIVNAAVNATRGQILTFRYRVFPAYFHSTCGGRTEDVSRVFAYNSIGPLSGTACPFCSESPFFCWTRTILKEHLAAKLRETFGSQARIGSVLSIEPIPPIGPAGRPGAFRVLHSSGELIVPATEFRLAVGAGAKDLPSVHLLEIRNRGEAIEFVGRGFGHGVGLCQYGSNALAVSGRDYRQILAFYYPGSELVKLYAM
ncbi:MAG: SpoIID/LytB domain-containing protein [Planctomycetota bacterium]|nr:SpoIID/LytB domain-containing protein [Planctomycetota bacterium]